MAAISLCEQRSDVKLRTLLKDCFRVGIDSHTLLCGKKRVLIVYPWTERYFGSFGDICTATAVLNNAKVAAHGRVVMRALDEAVRNMDNIKDTYAALSRLHYEKLNVDPDNFRLLADCITITVACKLRDALNPQAQAIWQKFLSAVVEAMSSQYS